MLIVVDNHSPRPYNKIKMFAALLATVVFSFSAVVVTEAPSAPAEDYGFGLFDGIKAGLGL